MDDSLLWVYEGLTQFWGTVLPVRAGLRRPREISRDARQSVAGTFDIQTGESLAAARRHRGRGARFSTTRRMPGNRAAAASTSTRPRSSCGSTSMRELRARSGGRASLDDFMKRFYAGAGGQPALKPYVEVGRLRDARGNRAGRLARAHPPPPRHARPAARCSRGSRAAGWQLEYSALKELLHRGPARSAARMTNRALVDRAAARRQGTRSSIPIEDAPPRAPAPAPGMKLIAVNGRQVQRRGAGRGDCGGARGPRSRSSCWWRTRDYYRTLSVAYFDGPRFPHLERIAGRADTLAENLRPRSN